jgi:hypothetical protein
MEIPTGQLESILASQGVEMDGLHFKRPLVKIFDRGSPARLTIYEQAP